MNTRIFVLLSITIAFTTLIHGQTLATSTARPILAPLKQTKISDCTSAQHLLWKETITLTYSPDGLDITGIDARGLPWKAVVPASGVMKCEVWSATLRPSFGEDILILNYGNSGSGYDNELTVLFFDRDGRPIPWETNAAFLSTDKGISQVGRLEADGAAGIVVPIREGDRHEGYVYVDHLYTMMNSSISKIVGSRGNRTWPIVTGNTKALIGNESNDANSAVLLSHPRTLDKSAESPVTALRQLSADDGPDQLLLSDGTKIAIPHIVVTDDLTKGREIFLAQYVPDGVKTIIKNRYFVTPQGQSCEEEECRPMILWGSKD